MSVLKTEILVEPQEIFSSSSTQGATLGQKATTGDGRYFRYVKAGGTTLVVGKLQQTAAETTGWENLTAPVAAIGATSITPSTTVTVGANALTNGFMMVTVTPGVGYVYQISGNTAASSATTTLTLADPIQVALTASSRLDLVLNPYDSVIVNPVPPTGFPLGVAVYPITNAQYGWIQVKGVGNILADGAVSVGTKVTASGSIVGAMKAWVSGATIVIGQAMTGISDTEYGSVNIELN